MYAIMFLASSEVMRDFFFNKDQVPFAREALVAGKYIATAPVNVGELLGEAAAEELFDLTNNPGRQEEREEKYGRGRSLSTGDIVAVNGEMFVCCSFGWKKL